ncbi:uncharacterized protein LOC111039726 [Myzus persicae]|uniref:uncharacterized protein LOC111039726 n=1 Tax=Myzus persicae TaxID=13164 RepID=UPI000B937FC1|nr:uncharacterized protein LOC111039726 [Myzus persicae]
MATNKKYQNISIQPPKIPRTSKTIYELPRQNLTESDLVKKSTSDRTKRRVAHKAWFPRPVITKPVVPVVPQRKPKKNHVLKKGFFSRVQPCRVRQINETVALDSARTQHGQSTSSGVDERVKADKRKLRDLDCDEVTKKKQKKNNADKAINKDVKEGKKSHKRKVMFSETSAGKADLKIRKKHIKN